MSQPAFKTSQSEQPYYKTPEYRSLSDSISALLHSAKTVFSIAHPFPDGDSIGSQLALHHYCIAKGKKSYCLNFDPLSEQLSWLPGTSDLVSDLPDCMQCDLGFLMETTDIVRMGDRTRFFSRANKLVHLDHHIGVKGLGHINILDNKASSTCEILYNILSSSGKRLSKEVMESLYLGIMTDTGNFRYSNTTPRAHEIAAKMVKSNLDIDGIYRIVYEETTLTRINIHGITMSRAATDGSGKIAYSWLTQSDLKHAHAKETDADGCVKHLCGIRDIEAAIFFKETETGRIKVSLRSIHSLNVRDISTTLGGGGHIQAAGAEIDGPMDDAIKKVLDLTVSQLNFTDN